MRKSSRHSSGGHRKEMMMSALKKKIFDFGSKLQLMDIATVTADHKPRVRYVVGIADLDQDGEFDDILWRNTVYGGVKVWLTAWPVFSQVPIGWMP